MECSAMKRNEIPVYVKTRMHFENIMLNERNQKQTATYHIIPFMWDVQEKQNYVDKIIVPLISSLALEKGASGTVWRGVAANW